ncbi:hypothetical protein VM1G_11770 [Cytospora mali]|uniref:Uncharacterized protein n=1 Tax=Cytospora mali TaxID=578113 RepID=A0A194W589_CYTMA|nr:hypothetical protein VM1G_11770 [Valsa mali]
MPSAEKIRGSQSTKVTCTSEPLSADLDQTAASRRIVDACVTGIDAGHPFRLAEFPEAIVRHDGVDSGGWCSPVTAVRKRSPGLLDQPAIKH